MKIPFVIFLLISLFITSFAQGPQNERQQFIRVEAPLIALLHVRVIDGVGSAAQEDQKLRIVPIAAPDQCFLIGPAVDVGPAPVGQVMIPARPADRQQSDAAPVQAVDQVACDAGVEVRLQQPGLPPRPRLLDEEQLT